MRRNSLSSADRAIQNLIATYAFLVDDGDTWRFAAREVSTDLVGDVSHHRRTAG